MVQSQENVVNNVTTKKNYVKPEFKSVELEWEAPLLVDSKESEGSASNRFRTLKDW